MKNYYIYKYVDPRDNTIKYIGKGTGDRMFQHWKIRNHHGNKMFKKFMLELDLISMEPIIEVIEDNLKNSDAYIKEFELIKKYGRIDIEDNGTLCNRSIGFEHFNIPEGMNIETYLDDRRHSNYKQLDDDTIHTICSMYLSGDGLVSIAKVLNMGPAKIKEVLELNNIPLRKKGGQKGKDNGMYGVKRENNAYFTGKTHKNASREKISKTLKLLDRGKHLKINEIEYISISEASKHSGIPASTIGRNIGKIIIRNNVSYKIEINNDIK